MARSEVISRVANTLVQISPQHSLRVAIDGITAVGKMTFADKLAEDVRAPVGDRAFEFQWKIFANPVRCASAWGRYSVEGYYENAYDYGALRSELLHPLGADGQRFLSLRGLRPCYRPADRCSNTEFRSRSDRHRRRQFPPTTRARQRMGRRRVPTRPGALRLLVLEAWHEMRPGSARSKMHFASTTPATTPPSAAISPRSTLRRRPCGRGPRRPAIPLYRAHRS